MYIAFKNKLITDFEERRDMIVISDRHSVPESLFAIRTRDDRIYSKIIDAFGAIAMSNVEDLIVNLFRNYKIEISKNSRTNWWDIEINDSGVGKKLVIMSSPMAMDSGRARWYAQNIAESESPVYFIFLVKDSLESQKAINRFMIRFQDYSQKFTCLIFEDFLEQFFGQEEKEKFQVSMQGFKDDFHKVIGYQVTEMCSPYNLNKLKICLEEELKHYPYQHIREKHLAENRKNNPFAQDIFDSKFATLLSKYIGSERYKLLLSSADFAESFLTSEWLYRKYITLESLDNTFIVTGYLKSVEQLLWDVALVMGQGRMIRGHKINESDNTEIDKTLGALEFFIGNWDNDDLFDPALRDVKHYFQNYLRNKISVWREFSRNGYFHKHKLESKEKIDTIREDTIYLYFLILGSLKFTDENIKRIIS